jgi:hypothetical protein
VSVDTEGERRLWREQYLRSRKTSRGNALCVHIKNGKSVVEMGKVRAKNVEEVEYTVTTGTSIAT